MVYRPLRVWDGQDWVNTGDPRVGPLATRIEALEAGGGEGGGDYQPLSPELTTIAGLVPDDGDVLRRDTGTWTSAPLTAAAVGLDQVDNTSDVDKPLSTAAAAALAGKAAARHADTHAAGGDDPLTADAIGAAPAGHTHPRVLGPYGTSSVTLSALSAPPKIIATVTVPDPGFPWRPVCFAEAEIRTNINGSRPALFVRSGSATGPAWAHGSSIDGGNLRAGESWWVQVQARPSYHPDQVDGALTLHLVAENDYGSGWIQVGGQHPNFVIYVLPA